MTSLLLYLILWLWDNRSFNTIDQSNRDKSEAESAYTRKNYATAARLYQKIALGSIFAEPASRLYLAHSYFHLDSLEKARAQYQLLLRVSDPAIASKSNTQLALISCMDSDTAAALEHLQAALRQDPSNQAARYDYELLKTVFSGKVPPPPAAKTPPPPESPRPVPLPPPVQQAAELADQRKELLQSLRRINMSEDQARLILDAMKTNESQYIYQLRRRQYYDHSERSKTIEW